MADFSFWVQAAERFRRLQPPGPERGEPQRASHNGLCAWWNPEGWLPVTAAEAASRGYQCPKCFSREPGEGVLLDGENNPAPCICASAEHIARQQERGFFK